MDTVTPGVSKDYKDSDQNEIQEQKDKLMAEILELQNTLHDLSQRVHAVKEENEQLQLDSQVKNVGLLNSNLSFY